jgi:transcriptional regulator CtsR
MRNLADAIEDFLIKLIDASEDNIIEIQRGDVAGLFSCAPSQINYVLQTRFAPERGYYVESRRGGGGFIRITRASHTSEEVLKRALASCREPMRQEMAGHLIQLLLAADLITSRESRLMLAVMDRQALMFELPWRDELRSSLLRAMLGTLIRCREGEE